MTPISGSPTDEQATVSKPPQPGSEIGDSGFRGASTPGTAPLNRDNASEITNKLPPRLPASQRFEELKRATESLSSRVLLGGLLVLIALVFLPTVRFSFVYDDDWTFLSNGFLRDPDLSVFFDSSGQQTHVPDLFRPVAVFFDLICYQLFGPIPLYQHIVAVLLHVGVCGALWSLLGQLKAPRLLQASSTLLFGLLALHAEAITVVSFREDLLAAGLGILALTIALRSAEQQGPILGSNFLKPAFGAWFLLALAIGCKMSAATLPGVFFLLATLSPWQTPAPDPSSGSSPSSWSKIILLTVLLCTAILPWYLQRTIVFGSFSPYSPNENLQIFANQIGSSKVWAASIQIHLRYLQQFFLPFGFRPEYIDHGASWSDPATLLGTVGFLALFVYGVSCGWKRRRPFAAFCILGSFLLILPTSNMFGMPNMQAERFMYLPSLPLCMALAYLCLEAGQRLSRRYENPGLILGPVLLMAIVQGSQSIAATSAYANNLTLWRVGVRSQPLSARAHASLGLHMLQAMRRRPPEENLPIKENDPRLGRVAGHCHAAMRFDPSDKLSSICWARLEAAQRNWTRAYKHFKTALALFPDRNDRVLGSMSLLSLDLPLENARAELNGLKDSQRYSPFSTEVSELLRSTYGAPLVIERLASKNNSSSVTNTQSNPLAHKISAREQLSASHLARALREYPYSPEVQATAARIAHLQGEAEAARKYLARALELRPERWETLALGLELALDTRDICAAVELWRQADDLLQAVDPAAYHLLRLHFAKAIRASDVATSTSACNPGVLFNAT